MFHPFFSWRADGFFGKLVFLIFVGLICSSCSLFISPPEGDSPPSEEEGEPKSSMPCDPVSKASIAALQFEETVSQEKIQFIEEFSKLDDEKLQQCLQAVTKKEVIALTISDMSRHTNSDLADKAKGLMNRFNFVSYVETEINSEDEERQKDIVEFLLRIEEDQAKKILASISFKKEETGTQINGEVSGGTRRVLIPSDSKQGDRYYVQASWDPANSDQLSCLTALFNKKLQAKRTLEQEEQKMKELNGKRKAYWYAKSWAVTMAESIEECGAEASFVEVLEGQFSPAQTPISDMEKMDSQSEAAAEGSASVKSEAGSKSEAAPEGSASVKPEAGSKSEAAPEGSASVKPETGSQSEAAAEGSASGKPGAGSQSEAVAEGSASGKPGAGSQSEA
ncbi:MAG: hypothetical protein OXB86_05070, partial [Bdellovibrionales bacterium]|nr:hypothetical protein [Bdellovibrionales bacterium]